MRIKCTHMYFKHESNVICKLFNHAYLYFMNQTCRESCLGTQCVFLFIYIKFYKYKNNNKFLYNFHNDLKLRKGPCLYFEIGCSRVLRFCEKGLSDDNSNNNRNEMKAQ